MSGGRSHVLPRRALGRTGLTVACLGLGGAELRGPGAYRGRDLPEDHCQCFLDACADAGIDYVDTSDDYGVSETRLGRFLARRRPTWTVATKCGADERLPPAPWGPARNLARENLLRGVARSLERLGVEALDVLQFHNPRPAEVREAGALATIEELRRRGWVRRIGMSAGGADLQEYLGWGVFDLVQVPYCVLDPREGPALERAAAAGVGVVVRGVTAKGLAGAPSRRAHLAPAALWRAARLDELAGDLAPPAFLLWCALAHPAIGCVLVGMADEAVLAANLAAARRPPPAPDLLAEVARRVAAHGRAV